MPLNNPRGSNQWSKRESYSDESLRAFLSDMSRERHGRGVPLKEQLVQINERFNYAISLSTLKAYRKKWNIGTCRKNTATDEEKRHHLIAVTAQDTQHRWSVERIQHELVKSGYPPQSREHVRAFLKTQAASASASERQSLNDEAHVAVALSPMTMSVSMSATTTPLKESLPLTLTRDTLDLGPIDPLLPLEPYKDDTRS